MRTLIADTRLAVRALAKQPRYTTVASLTLAAEKLPSESAVMSPWNAPLMAIFLIAPAATMFWKTKSLLVLIDPIGGPIAVALAEELGARAVLVTPDHVAGNELSRSGDLAPANARLQQAGVELHRRTLLRAVKKASAEVEDRFSGERRSLRVVAVVDAGHRLPDPAFASTDGSWPAGSRRAGDVVAPRTIHEAILEGRRAAQAVGGVGRTSDGVPMGTSH